MKQYYLKRQLHKASPTRNLATAQNGNGLVNGVSADLRQSNADDFPF